MLRYRETAQEVYFIDGVEVVIQKGDITTSNADAIATSDDTDLSMGGGVSAAVLHAAGPAVWEESRQLVPQALGTAGMTSGGALSVQFIFHAAVLDYSKEYPADLSIVRSVTADCLRQADDERCRSIALPAFGTGVGGLTGEAAATAMLGMISERASMLQHIKQISVIIATDQLLIDFVKFSIESRFEVQFAERLRSLEVERDRLAAQVRQASPYNMLPFPIAITRRMIDMHHTGHSKFTSAIECMESILKYCTAIVMADCLRLQVISIEEVCALFSRHATLGFWQERLSTGLRELDSRNSLPVIDTIRAFYSGKNRGKFAQMIETRNKVHGHGGTLSEDSYNEKFIQMKSILDNLIQQINSDKFGKLVVPISIDITPTEFQYDVISVMGDNIVFAKEKLKSERLRLSRGILYLLDQDGSALNLAPFCVFENCPLCGMQETFFLEEVTLKKTVYHTVRANHRIERNTLALPANASF